MDPQTSINWMLSIFKHKPSLIGKALLITLIQPLKERKQETLMDFPWLTRIRASVAIKKPTKKSTIKCHLISSNLKLLRSLLYQSKRIDLLKFMTSLILASTQEILLIIQASLTLKRHKICCKVFNKMLTLSIILSMVVFTSQVRKPRNCCLKTYRSGKASEGTKAAQVSTKWPNN